MVTINQSKCTRIPVDLNVHENVHENHKLALQGDCRFVVQFHWKTGAGAVSYFVMRCVSSLLLKTLFPRGVHKFSKNLGAI